MSSINRSELVERYAQRFPGKTFREVQTCADCLLGYMSEILASGDRIELRGFGSFSLNTVPARIGRNPKTGEKVAVAERKRIHFKCSKAILYKLNR